MRKSSARPRQFLNRRGATFKLIIDERTVITERLQQLLVGGNVSIERILLQY
jgi:hypothetical protein